MSTIVEADEHGALHLPPSLLPEPGPHRRYRVATAGGHVTVAEAASPGSRPWMELAGCMKGESEELRRVEEIIAAEFEAIEPEEWR